MGGAFPTTVERAADDRSWVVFCQAPEDTDGDGELRVSLGPRGELVGDELNMYLALAGSEPLLIDALWAVDPSQRWVVVRHLGQALIVDTRTGHRMPAPKRADLAEAPGAYPLHRGLAFEKRAGTHLIWSQVVSEASFEIRTLALEGSRAASAFTGVGKLVTLTASHDGAWWVMQTVEQDTNENGRLDPPFSPVRSKRRCRGSFSTLAVWPSQADEIVTRVRSSKTGEVFRVDDFAGPLGSGYLFRDERGALFSRKGALRTLIAPDDCGAQVVHADAERELVLVACRGPQLEQAGSEERRRARARNKRRSLPPPRTRLPLWLVGRGVSQELQLELAPTGADRWAQGSPRLVPIHAGSERRLLDMHTKKLLPLGARDSVLGTFGTRALIVRPGELELLDAVLGESLVRIEEELPLAEARITGRFALVPPYVLDLSSGRVLGRVDGDAYALSADGKVLQLRQSSIDRLPLGPLTWQAPE